MSFLGLCSSLLLSPRKQSLIDDVFGEPDHITSCPGLMVFLVLPQFFMDLQHRMKYLFYVVRSRISATSDVVLRVLESLVCKGAPNGLVLLKKFVELLVFEILYFGFREGHRRYHSEVQE